MRVPDPTLSIFEQGNCLRVQFSMVIRKAVDFWLFMRIRLNGAPCTRTSGVTQLSAASLYTDGTRYLRAEHRLINREYVTAGGDIMYLSTTGDTLIEGRPINIARIIFREIVNRAVLSIRGSH